GAPRARVVEAALWAAFARHGAEAGRVVVAAGAARGLVEALTAGAERLRVGDPRDPATDVAAEPAVIAGLSADDLQFRDPPPGPALAVVEAPDSAAAVEIAAREAGAGPVSIWARDAAAGERVARRLAAPATWIGHHGVPETAPAVRLARHVVPRQVESRAAWAPGAPRAVAAQTALTELRYGRESRRWAALRTLIRR
ncbi:MAG TPA: hypothetical protein VFG79_15815, partial [Solirubrobacter sp.]|nr:hypothetical protein [Solirubrobacter sp.]